MNILRRGIEISGKLVRGIDFISPAADLAARLWLANVFWKAGLTKTASWESTVMLFTYEYQVPWFTPETAALLAAAVELGGAALLAAGLGGRFAATALFILNAVAVISYPDLSEGGLRDHIFWGILLVLFFFRGPGKLSLDYLIKRKLFS